MEVLMRWLNTLFTLSELPPEALEYIVTHRALDFSLQRVPNQKGVVRFAHDHSGVLVGITVIVSPSCSRSEREVTLVHELFHLILGGAHPEGDLMMRCLSGRAYSFVEREIDGQSYQFRDRHPEFVRQLYDRLFGRFK